MTKKELAVYCMNPNQDWEEDVQVVVKNPLNADVNEMHFASLKLENGMLVLSM